MKSKSDGAEVMSGESSFRTWWLEIDEEDCTSWLGFCASLTQREGADAVTSSSAAAAAAAAAGQHETGPKRLHVSNIPFRFRETDLRNLLAVCICACMR